MATEADLRSALDKYGLGFLFETFNRSLVPVSQIDVSNEDAIYNAIESQPAVKKAFDDRFAGNATRVANGLDPLKPSEYIAAEKELTQTLRNTGLPMGFYDQPTDLAKFIGSDVSPVELQNRIVGGYRAAQAADPGTKEELRRLYGIGEADLAAFYLDPTRATDTLGRKADSTLMARQIGAAQIAGQAQQQAGIGLSAAQAETLAAEGVTMGAARQGFATIAEQQGLFQAQMAGEQAISQEEQISGTFGTSAAAAQRIATRRRRRQAEFEAGGTFAAGQRGVAGLGTATQ